MELDAILGCPLSQVLRSLSWLHAGGDDEMGGGEGEDEAGMVTSIDESDCGVHGEAILAAMPVRRAAQRGCCFVWLTLLRLAHAPGLGLCLLGAASFGSPRQGLGTGCTFFLKPCYP